jgi:hypothetical protein
MNTTLQINLSVEELQTIIKNCVREELDKEKEKENDLMSFDECREFLKISTSGLNKWKSENKIPYKKMGKRIFFSRTEVLQALEDSHYYRLKELD